MIAGPDIPEATLDRGLALVEDSGRAREACDARGGRQHVRDPAGLDLDVVLRRRLARVVARANEGTGEHVRKAERAPVLERDLARRGGGARVGERRASLVVDRPARLVLKADQLERPPCERLPLLDQLSLKARHL